MRILNCYSVAMAAVSFFVGFGNQAMAQEFPPGCNLGRNAVSAGFSVADETGKILASGREMGRGETFHIVVMTQLVDQNDCAFGFGGFKAVIPKSGKTVYGFTHGDTMPLVAHTPNGSLTSFRALSNAIKIEEDDVEFCPETQKECVRVNYYLGASTDSPELSGMATLTYPVNGSSWSGGVVLSVSDGADGNSDNPGETPDDIKPGRLEKRLMRKVAVLEARIERVRARRKLHLAGLAN